ncbi:MAG: hypothetical protein ABSF68_12885 [Candidatus Acidiferrales bacterium]
MIRASALVLACLVMCASGFAQSPGVKPSQNTSAQPAPSIAHDTHEGMTILADAYDDGGRAKEKFGKADPIPAGILPVEIFLRNESDHPIRIDLNTIQLEVHFRNGQHQDIDSLKPSEAAYLIAHPQGPSGPKNGRIPHVSLPGGDKKSAKIEDILQPLALDADVVPPMATIHGFLYFDLSRDMSLAGASVLYVPDAVVIPGNKPLMFFEVPLAKTPQD